MPYHKKYESRQPHKRDTESVEYAYYPDGDIDAVSRRTRIGLVCEGNEWRVMGSSKTLSSERFNEMKNNIASGRGQIFRKLSDSRRIDGAHDLLSGSPRKTDRWAA